MLLSRQVNAWFFGLGLVGSSLTACDNPVHPTLAADVQLTVGKTLLAVGDSTLLGTVVRGGDGSELAGTAVRRWVSDTARARVDANGYLHGRAAGDVRVYVGADTAVDSAAVRVTRAASIEILGGADSLRSGSTLVLTARVRDIAGEVIDSAAVEWTNLSTNIVDLLAGVSNYYADTDTDTIQRLIVRGHGEGAVVVTTEGRADTLRVWTYSVPIFEATGFVALSMDVFHSCALDAGGAGWCWGQNGRGQLGDGSTTSSSTPRPVTGGHAFVSIHTSRNHSCGLTADGAAWCWGNNGNAELGQGTRLTSTCTSSSSCYSATPLLVPDRTFSAFDAAGHSHSCGIERADSTVYCWGHNDGGQVGREPNSPVDSIVAPVPGMPKARAIGGQHFHNCALDIEGRPWCWGRGMNPGWPDSADVPPRRLSATASFVSIRSGLYHTCALTAAGEAHCWGYNGANELGTGADTSYTIFRPPAPVTGGARFTALAPGDGFTCGLGLDGGLYCWGSLSPLGPRSGTPVRVVTDLSFRAIATNSLQPNRICAATTSGDLYCW